MQIIQEKMLEALRCFLNGTKTDWQDGLSAGDWAALFKLSSQHQILPMIFEAVYSCPAFSSAPPELVQTLRGQAVRLVMVQGRKTMELLQLYPRLVQQGATPAVVKGLVCRSLYPFADHRTSGDEDILIPPEQFSTCHRVFVENGMAPLAPADDLDAAGEVPYRKQNGLLYVELHKELFPSESEAYGELNGLFDGMFDRLTTVKIDGVEVYTLSHTDHLLYLILHAFKHFLHSGFGIRQVCDIVLYAQTYGAQIDWPHVQHACASVRADGFAAALFDIGKKHLCLDAEKACLPPDWAAPRVDGEALLQDLLDGGVFGDADMSRKHSSQITLNTVSAQKQGKQAKSSVLKTIFLPAKSLQGRYPYLKKHPYLLPVAWANRIWKYQKEVRHSSNNDAASSMEIGKRRVELLKQYNIIDQ